MPRPELMVEILASIAPVRTDAALRNILAEHFPRDCSNLPISGGWGYGEADAVVFVRGLFPIPALVDFVPLEYHVVQIGYFRSATVAIRGGAKALAVSPRLSAVAGAAKRLWPARDMLELTAVQRHARRSNRKGPAWQNLVQCARESLVRKGLLDGSRHGQWRLTAEGHAQAEKFLSFDPRANGL